MTLSATINGALRKFPAWPLYISAAAYTAWEFWRAVTQQGPYLVEPINVLERTYGEIALILLVAGLLVTPLRQWTGVNLIKFRRAIGLCAFFFVLAHFLVFAVLDVQSFGRVWTETVKRPYVTVGMLAFVLLIPLAVTSNNLAIRKMGAAAWRQLHKLSYVAVILGALHYLWLSRGFQVEPLIYLVLSIGLVALRYRHVTWRRQAA
ncbi:protein-methionine-sulfoxide reductase heme-binding subunit MsrQ [Yoonia sp.]|jgi:sulfoxide reductase heme-binding subunit YedZ|uniref:protein-methionine-sulfoxide reductase heme-binding subunit MsrQ n=1 Tax=Yoonia sp. TaxID=2212373 RepID=UPI003D4591F2